MRFRTLVILPVFAVLLLAACSTGVETAAPAGVPAESEEAVSEPVQVETEAALKPTDAQTGMAVGAPPTEIPPTDVPPTGEAAVVEDPASPACTSKSGLSATDPATVSLASGEVQLVEFFAFW